MSFLSGLGPAEFLAQFKLLHPPGRVFSGDPDTVQNQLFTPPADALAALHTGAVELLEVEADPAFTVQLLTEWETDYGLPDPCTMLGSTISQRRAALLAKIASLGGQSRAYFIQVAAAYGYTITITEFKPRRFGQPFGEPFNSTAWAFVWAINMASSAVVKPRRFGDPFGQPFAAWGDSEFECRMNWLKPAHTLLLFLHGGIVVGPPPPMEGDLYNNGGVLCLTALGTWPDHETGLSAGKVWSNGLVASVVPGVTPNPAAPPVYLSSITSAGLLALGGGDLPWSGVTPGSTQLYNPGGGGEIWVA